MTGISADHGTRAELHPDGCRCLKCIDVAIVAEDNRAITEHPWIDARRESAMTEAQRLADEKAEEYNGWLLKIADQYGLTVEEIALMNALCADQTPDHDDWLAGAWM